MIFILKKLKIMKMYINQNLLLNEKLNKLYNKYINKDKI